MRKKPQKTEPALPQVYTDDTPMPIGKYAGVPLKDVPAGQLLAMVDSGVCRHQALRQYIESNMDTLKQEYKQFKK